MLNVEESRRSEKSPICMRTVTGAVECFQCYKKSPMCESDKSPNSSRHCRSSASSQACGFDQTRRSGLLWNSHRCEEVTESELGAVCCPHVTNWCHRVTRIGIVMQKSRRGKVAESESALEITTDLRRPALEMNLPKTRVLNPTLMYKTEPKTIKILLASDVSSIQANTIRKLVISLQLILRQRSRPTTPRPKPMVNPIQMDDRILPLPLVQFIRMRALIQVPGRVP
jgi:hypothetical protein